MKTKLLEMYHYSELIAPIDEQIDRFEKENLTYSVKKVISLGKIDIGQANYISYFLIIYRFSIRKTIKNLPKILGIYWKKK
jgi:hypothetical protein